MAEKAEKKVYEKLTLEALIAKKDAALSRKKRTAELFVEGLGGTVTIQAPSPSLLADVFEMHDADGDRYLIYRSVVDPCLSDSGVMEAYGASDPMELMDKLFMPGEIARIAAECMKLAGYSAGSVTKADQAEKVKN